MAGVEIRQNFRCKMPCLIKREQGCNLINSMLKFSQSEHLNRAKSRLATGGNFVVVVGVINVDVITDHFKKAYRVIESLA